MDFPEMMRLLKEAVGIRDEAKKLGEDDRAVLADNLVRYWKGRIASEAGELKPSEALGVIQELLILI